MRARTTPRSISRIILIATCAKRKRFLGTPAHQVADLRGLPPEQRAREWCAQLEATLPEALIPAQDLYVGDYWTAVLRLKTHLDQLDTNSAIWIASAGYGLIPGSAHIGAYEATLAQRDAAFVGDRRSETDNAIAWWNQLASWAGPAPGMPRTLTALMRWEPHATFLLLLSENYLRALHDDLLAAVEAHGSDRIILATAAPRVATEMRPSTLRFNSSLSIALGGTTHSLNARVALAAIRDAGVVSKEPMQKAIDHLAGTVERRPTISRTRVGDSEILAWISDRVHADSSATKSSLLRELRNKSGVACEQSRFAKLYNVVCSTAELLA